jgi:cobaltochelatase CobS
MTTPAIEKAVIDRLTKINKAKEKIEAGTPAVPEIVAHVPKDTGNKRPMSEVFDVKVTEMDHAVPVFKDTDWPESVRHLIPEVDPGYVFPIEALEESLAGLWHHHDNVFAHGPKGSGKSSLFHQICARQRIPFVRINCRLDMESSAIFGSIVFDPINGISWKDGPAAELAKTGGILCIDEIAQMPAGIAMSMQYMLERGGRVFLADKPGSSTEKTIVPHESFRLVATDNTQLQGDNTGHYVGAQIQNEAMLDRFGTTIELDYLSDKHERKVLKNRIPSLPDSWITDMLSISKLVRTGYEKGTIQFTMSPRGLINWGEKAIYWGSLKRGFHISFFSKLVETDQKLTAEIWKKVTSTELE